MTQAVKTTNDDREATRKFILEAGGQP
jgi:hypothetical protein